jgi:hypothetical protein
MLDVEEEIPELVFVAVFVVVVPDEPPLVDPYVVVVLAEAITYTLKLYDELAFIVSARST